MGKYEERWNEIIFYLSIDRKTDYYGQMTENPSIHLMIAHDILNPIIHAWDDEIKLWRFHRMIVIFKENVVEHLNRHEFKFKYYSNKGIADSFNKAVKSEFPNNSSYWEVISNIKYKVCTGDSKVKDDNDDSWPYMIKYIWPYYINGVSRAWLKAIEDGVQDVEREIDSFRLMTFEEKLTAYEKVSSIINKNWSQWAQHSFFHHANLIFGNCWIDFLKMKNQTNLKNYKHKQKNKFKKDEYVTGRIKF